MINASNSSNYNTSNLLNGTMVVNSLTIVQVQTSDVGIYTCHAENIIGSDRSSGVLTVNGTVIVTHTVLYCCYINYFTDGVEILEPTESLAEYAVEGRNITLRCVGVGYPPPLVEWRKLNGSLSDRVSSTNMSMSTNEGNVTRVTVDLMITRVSRKDTGVYECSVSSLLNIVTRSINLTIQCMYICTYVQSIVTL